MGLIAVSAFEMLELPLMGGYLYSRGILSQMPDIDPLLSLEADFLAAGVFFWLIAKIMERAAKMQEENDLTV